MHPRTETEIRQTCDDALSRLRRRINEHHRREIANTMSVDPGPLYDGITDVEFDGMVGDLLQAIKSEIKRPV